MSGLFVLGARLASSLASTVAGMGAALLGYRPAGIGAIGRTTEHKLRELPTAGDFGALSDGVTDDTAACILAAQSGHKVLILPPNTKFNTKTLIASIPQGVALLDLSGINDFSAPGETCRRIGVLSADSGPSDTHFALGNRHHAILTLNNYGGAGSASALEGKASIMWCRGQFERGALDKRGFRGGTVFQWTKDTGTNWWALVLRSLAPWASLEGEYEYWDVAEAIPGANVYRENAGNHYRSVGAINAGGAAPVHTSGTVGGWEWLDSSDRTVFSFDQHGRVMLGGAAAGAATFFHKVTKTDPGGGAYSYEGQARGVDKTAQMRLTPTDGAGLEVPMPFMRAQAGVGVRFMNSGATTDLARLDDARGLVVKQRATIIGTAPNLASTPSVAGVGALWVGNTAATNITDLSGWDEEQEVTLIFANANTTLVNSPTFRLQDGVNFTPTAYTEVRFRRLPAALASMWIESGRCKK